MMDDRLQFTVGRPLGLRRSPPLRLLLYFRRGRQPLEELFGGIFIFVVLLILLLLLPLSVLVHVSFRDDPFRLGLFCRRRRWGRRSSTPLQRPVGIEFAGGPAVIIIIAIVSDALRQ